MGKSQEFKEGALASFPTSMGYVSIGIACGLVGSSSGISPLEMGLMSLIVYGGSSQFVMSALIFAHAPLFSIVLTVFLINLRHFLMSLHTTTIFKDNSLLGNIAIGSLLTDESYGVMLLEQAKGHHISPSWMNGNNLTGYLTWFVATVVGSVFGQFIPDPEKFGFDYALVAMFVAIFIGQLMASLSIQRVKTICAVLVTVFIAYLIFIPFLSSSLSVLGATLLSCFVGVIVDES